MHFDLELFLAVGALLTGGIWLLDRLKWRPERMAASGAASARIAEEVAEEKEPLVVEYSRSFFPVLVVVLVLRTFIAEPFRIPSGSMIPTLHVGDFILVNKFAYGLRLPVVHTKIVPVGEPRRGDVMVFRYPRDERLDYIKRVVGLPGDIIRFDGKKVIVNGQALSYEEIGPYTESAAEDRDHAIRLTEDLLGVKHDILVNPGRPNIEGEVTVPEGHYFAVGDNRDNSNDSRYWGFVPEENLVGRAMVIWMNWNFEKKAVEFSRIGTVIR